MTHKYRHKQLQRIKQKYKNLAAIVAAATILSTAMLPGIPTATAHASSGSNANNLSATTSQEVGKTNQSSAQINFNSSVTPRQETKQESKIEPSNPKADKTVMATQKQKEKVESQSKVREPNSTVDQTPKTTTETKPNSASETPAPKTPAPETPVPVTPAPETPTPATPAPETPAPETPAPATPAPETPAPATPAPETPAPETPAPETPAPATPAPETPAPATPAPETPAPETPAPETPAPETPAPETPAPETPAPETPAPETPAPETPAPETPAPETPAPATPAPPIDNPSANAPPTNYTKVLDISATAYAPGPHDNGQWGNKTHIGSQVRPGIIAVDPKVIPLGSRVYIEYPDGHGEYAIAEDTGGAIKGNRVDVAKWTVNEAKDFGIQKVKVYVVNTPEKV